VSGRGRGCELRSAPHKLARLPSIHALLGTTADVAPSYAPSSDLTAHLPNRLDQGFSGSCGGHAPAVWLFVACSIAGISLGFSGPPSPRGLYACSRAPHQPGTGPLEDSGVEAADPVDAAQTVGVRAMEVTITPDGRRSDIWTTADLQQAGIVGVPANDGYRPTAAEDLECAKHLVLGAYLIDTGSPFFTAIVAATLTAAKPVAVTCFVDMTFERWGDSDVAKAKPLDGSPNYQDPKGGGHYLTAMAHRTEADGRLAFLLVNSWGAVWGVTPPSLPLVDDRKPLEAGEALPPEAGCIWVTETWLRAACTEATGITVGLKEAA
jgi:hypothetical protein